MRKNEVIFHHKLVLQLSTPIPHYGSRQTLDDWDHRWLDGYGVASTDVARPQSRSFPLFRETRTPTNDSRTCRWEMAQQIRHCAPAGPGPLFQWTLVQCVCVRCEKPLSFWLSSKHAPPPFRWHLKSNRNARLSTGAGLQFISPAAVAGTPLYRRCRIDSSTQPVVFPFLRIRQAEERAARGTRHRNGFSRSVTRPHPIKIKIKIKNRPIAQPSPF